MLHLHLHLHRQLLLVLREPRPCPTPSLVQHPTSSSCPRPVGAAAAAVTTNPPVAYTLRLLQSPLSPGRPEPLRQLGLGCCPRAVIALGNARKLCSHKIPGGNPAPAPRSPPATLLLLLPPSPSFLSRSSLTHSLPPSLSVLPIDNLLRRALQPTRGARGASERVPQAATARASERSTQGGGASEREEGQRSRPTPDVFWNTQTTAIPAPGARGRPRPRAKRKQHQQEQEQEQRKSSAAAEWSAPLSFSAGKWGLSFCEMAQDEALPAAFRFSDQSGQMQTSPVPSGTSAKQAVPLAPSADLSAPRPLAPQAPTPNMSFSRTCSLYNRLPACFSFHGTVCTVVVLSRSLR